MRDLTNSRHGTWVVVSYAGRIGSNTKWLCRCDCGTEYLFQTAYITGGLLTTCRRCKKRQRVEDTAKMSTEFLGRVYGSYTVISYVGQTKYGSRLWRCQCACGYERDFPTAYLSGNGRRKPTRCPACVLAQMEMDNRVTNDIPYRFWKRLEDRCHRPGFRGKIITLTREDALRLYQAQGGSCAITGTPLWFTKLRTNFNRYTNASLDRIDSGKPYEDGNVQWVHKVVNMMKGSLTQTEFLDWCLKVINGPLMAGA